MSNLLSMLAENGYTNIRKVGQQLCGLQCFMFTTGLMVGLDANGYQRRYCYEHREEALEALKTWDGTGHPSGPWIKMKGGGAELLNPELRA